VKARVGPRFAAALFGTTLALSVLEVGLRLAPQAISPYLLVLFEPELRSRLASGSLLVRRDFEALERDDEGPPLYVRKPEARIASMDERGVESESRTDEIGFCNPPGSYENHATIDLIAVGDSFTWCHNVKAKQAWVYRLGQRLRTTTYNLGRGGSGLYEYLQVLKRFGLAKQPRIVVFNVYAGNDLRDADAYWTYRKELERTGQLPPREEPQSLLPAVTQGPLGRHSYAANFMLAFATRVRDHWLEPSEESRVNFRYSLELPGGSVRFNEHDRDEDEVVYAHRLATGRVSLELWEDALRQLGELAKSHGFAAVVTYTPSAHTSYAPRVRFSDPAIAPVLAQLNRAQREFLAARAEILGYAFHDLTPSLLDAAARSDVDSLLYHPSSLHLTPQGHEAIAASLAKFLVERGLAPKS
jgi:hypothetical protein